MPEGQLVIFDADDGSILRACDFGPEFGDERRYLTLPDLVPIVPTEEEGIYIVCGHLNLRFRLGKS